jgi:hypothetical protein
MRYLARIKDDALHGRAPTAVDFDASGAGSHKIGENRNLKQFLARAKGAAVVGKEDAAGRLSSDISYRESNTKAKAVHIVDVLRHQQSEYLTTEVQTLLSCRNTDSVTKAAIPRRV